MYKKYNPYLENGTDPHNRQWQDRQWTAGDWIAQRKGGGMELVQGFYKSDIIRSQEVDDSIPVVTVGPNFYRLGGFDKRRVIASIDQVYGVTAQSKNGTILLHDWNTGEQIGFFTRHGLTIQ